VISILKVTLKAGSSLLLWPFAVTDLISNSAQDYLPATVT